MKRSKFGLNLIRIRKERGLSQQELAEITGFSQRLIAYYETKAKKLPIDNLKILADSLSVSVNDLVGESKINEIKLPKHLAELITEIDTKTLKKLAQIKALPANDRTIIYNMINSLAEKNRLKDKVK